MSLLTACYGRHSHPPWPIISAANALELQPCFAKVATTSKKGRATQKSFVLCLNNMVNESRLHLLILRTGLWSDVKAWPQMAAPRWRSEQTDPLVCTQTFVANFRYESSDWSLGSHRQISHKETEDLLIFRKNLPNKYLILHPTCFSCVVMNTFS